jgi:hypothetical protein
MKFKKLTIEDIPEIIRMENTVSGSIYQHNTKEEMVEMISDGLSYGLLINQKMVGFNLAFKETEDVYGIPKDDVIISDATVILEEYRGNSYQFVLHSHRDKKHKRKYVVTKTSPYNLASLKNLLKYGFKIDRLIEKDLSSKNPFPYCEESNKTVGYPTKEPKYLRYLLVFQSSD